jgi:hypothetical protein
VEIPAGVAGDIDRWMCYKKGTDMEDFKRKITKALWIVLASSAAWRFSGLSS